MNKKIIKLYVDDENFFVVLVTYNMGQIVSHRGKMAGILRRCMPKKRFKTISFKHNGQNYFFNRDIHGWHTNNFEIANKKKKSLPKTPEKQEPWGIVNTSRSTYVEVERYVNGIYSKTLSVENWEKFCREQKFGGFERVSKRSIVLFNSGVGHVGRSTCEYRLKK